MKNFIHAIARFLKGLKRPSKEKNTRLLNERGETPGSFIIREAVYNDIPALSALHVKTWIQTYPGVRYSPPYDIREYQWREQFNVTDQSWFCFVIENKEHELVGFAKGKRYATGDLPEFSGELNKLYILRDYQRVGLGRRLIGYVVRKFISIGINNMVLFGEPNNPSGAFHEATGAEKLYTKNGQFHGGYCWHDLAKLAAN